MRSIRASTTASVLVRPIVGLDLALVLLHDSHHPLDGGAQSEEQSEVHDPVCVELAIEEVAGTAPDHKTEIYLDSEGAGGGRRTPEFFAIRVDGAAFV